MVDAEIRARLVLSLHLVSHSSNKIEAIKSKPIHLANGCAK
jgi:hypothetical protein